MPTLKSTAVIVAAAIGILATGIPIAHAVVLDSTDIAIGVPNTGLSGFSGPFANVHNDLTSTTTASVSFTSLTIGGYLYLLGGQGAADLNVNGSYNLTRLPSRMQSAASARVLTRTFPAMSQASANST
jgi:hypothetical protein